MIGLHDDRLALVFIAPLFAALLLFSLARAPGLWARVVVAVGAQLVAAVAGIALSVRVLSRGGFAFVDIEGWAGARIDGVDPFGAVPVVLTPGTVPLLVAVLVAAALACWLLVPAALKARSTAPLAAVNAAAAFCALLVVARGADAICAAFALSGVAGFVLLVSFHPQRPDVEGTVRAFLLQRAGDILLLAAVFIVGAVLGDPAHPAHLEHLVHLDIDALVATASAVDPDARAAAGPLAGVAARDVWQLLGWLVVAAASSRLAFGPLLPLVRDAVGAPGPAVGFAHGVCFAGAGLILIVRMTPVLWLAPDAMVFLAWAAASGAVIAGLFAIAGRDLVRIDVHLLCGFGALAAFAFAAADLGTGTLAAALLIAAAVPLCATSGVVVEATGRADPHALGGLEKMLPRTHTTRLLVTGALFGPIFAGSFVAAHALASSLFAPWMGARACAVVVVGLAVLAVAAFRPLHLVFTGAGVREPLARTCAEPGWLRTLPPLVVALPLVGAGLLHIPEGILGAVPSSIAQVTYKSPAWSLWLPEQRLLLPVRERVLAAWAPPSVHPMTVALTALGALLVGWAVSTALYRSGPRKLHQRLFGGARVQKLVALLANAAGRESQVAKGVGEGAARLSRLIATNFAPGVLDTLLRRIPTLVGMVAGFIVRFLANGSAQRGLVVALVVLAVLALVLR